MAVTDTLGAGDTASQNGHESDNSNAAASDIDAKMNKMMSNWMGRIEKKMQTMIPQMVQQSLETLVTTEPAKVGAARNTPAGDGAGGGDRTTLKSMQGQLEQLQKQLLGERSEREKATAREKDTRIRTEFQTKLQEKLGAGNPLVNILTKSLYDADKRVMEDPTTGRLVMKFAQDGYEEFKSLEEGMVELFNKELKPLLSPSKVGRLPTDAGGQKRPVMQVNNGDQVQSKDGRPNPFAAEIAHHLVATNRADQAQDVVSAFANQDPYVQPKSK